MSSFLSNDELDQLAADYPDEYKPGCPTCHGARSYRYNGGSWPCHCAEQKRLLTRYLHAGIGLTYQRLLWTDLTIPGETLDVPLDYIENPQPYLDHGLGLFIHGPTGTGKTTLANLILKELVKRDISCYATTFSQTVESFTATWSDVTEKARFAKRFMNTKVLLLDDLGKEFRSKSRLQQTTFDHILRTRVQNNRPTILTTNINAAELVIGYGASVLSLLYEKSISVSLTGDDFRKAAFDRAIAEKNAGEVAPIT
jgi:Cdc6-like AAA superfamily ATPase